MIIINKASGVFMRLGRLHIWLMCSNSRNGTVFVLFWCGGGGGAGMDGGGASLYFFFVFKRVLRV